MASTNRTGRVSAVDYAAGTYEVTYFDRGRSVTKKINAVSNGEYRMPAIGQLVSVVHNSNGTAAGCSAGTIWNQSNRPAEGYAGLYRREYANEPGRAYERYDENEGIYTQYTDKGTGRTCNGDILDEAKGAVSLVALGPAQLASTDSSVSISAAAGSAVSAGTNVDIQAGGYLSLEAEGEISEAAGGKRTLSVAGEDEEIYKKAVKREFQEGVTDDVTGPVEQSVIGDVSREVAGRAELAVQGAVAVRISKGELTLKINGVAVTVSQAGDVMIESPTRIEMKAPEVKITGETGEVKIGEIKLTEHKHAGTDNPIP